jgi:hypothetical protein
LYVSLLMIVAAGETVTVSSGSTTLTSASSSSSSVTSSKSFLDRTSGGIPSISATSSEAANSTVTSTSQKKKIGGGAIAGIVVGVVLGLLLLIGLACAGLLLRKRRAAKNAQSVPASTLEQEKIGQNYPEVANNVLRSNEPSELAGNRGSRWNTSELAGNRGSGWNTSELEGDKGANTEFFAAASAPMVTAAEQSKDEADGLIPASPIIRVPVPQTPQGLTSSTTASTDPNMDSIHEEYARVQQRRNHLQELMRLQDEEERLRRQIQGRSLSQSPPTELPSYHP